MKNKSTIYIVQAAVIAALYSSAHNFTKHTFTGLCINGSSISCVGNF